MKKVPPEVNAYLAEIGHRGGRKSRRHLSSDDARDMVRVREALRIFRLSELIEEYRERCLWFMRKDYQPKTTAEILKVLEMIERYGDRAGYERAEEIKSWLSPHSRAEY